MDPVLWQPGQTMYCIRSTERIQCDLQDTSPRQLSVHVITLATAVYLFCRRAVCCRDTAVELSVPYSVCGCETVRES